MLKLSVFCSDLVNLGPFYIKYEVKLSFISLEWKNIYFGGPYFIEIGLEPNYGVVIVHDI